MYVETRSVGDLAAGNASEVSHKVSLASLPDGRAGTIQTLKYMRDFVTKSLRDPSQRVRTVANDIFKAAGVRPRDFLGEIYALHAFVRDRIRYVRDPVGLELVQEPTATLDKGYGDCDDKSTLLGALLMATGHPSKLTVVAFRGGPFSHVLTETRYNNKSIPLETIIPKAPGWFPPGVTDKYSLDLKKG